MFHGRCYTIRIADDFLNHGTLVIRLKSSIQLVAFAHEPGYEFWTHLGLYPEKPKMVKLENVDGITDFLITKSVHKKAKYCVDDFEYSQYHCLVEEYKKGQSKLGMECVTPWTQSILDGKNNKRIFCFKY